MACKPGVAPSLTQDQIIEAAFDLIDESGIQAFSLRGLGKRLGVSPMAFYTYFSSKEEILAGVQARLGRMYDNAPVPGEYWVETLKRTMSSIRRADLAHANVYMGLRSYGWAPSVKRHTRRIYQIHKDQGIPLEIYRPMWSIIEAYLVGFIGQEIKQRTAVFEPLDPATPDYEWMLIAETAYTDESFLRGIDLIVGGIERLAAPDPCDWRTPEDPALWSWSSTE